MGAVRIRIPDTLDYAKLTFLEHRTEERHSSVQPESILDLDQIFLLFPDVRPGLVVGIIAERNERVQPVVASRHLQHDEYRIVFATGELNRTVARLVAELRKCPVNEAR